jgi:urease accessory protein UreH
VTNALLLKACLREGRTVVGTIRTSGLCRASRPFREAAAARVVVSQLGPGMVRGDAFSAGGAVARGAHLIVAGQMATRVLSGPDSVTNTTRWSVESGGTLELLAEPTLVSAGAAYEARTELLLQPGARAVVVEVVHRERGAALAVTTVARRGERLACADALRFAASDDDESAIGTLLVFGSTNREALDRAADACPNVRFGIDALRDGDILARAVGTSVWEVRAALLALRAVALERES